MLGYQLKGTKRRKSVHSKLNKCRKRVVLKNHSEDLGITMSEIRLYKLAKEMDSEGK